MMQACKKEEKKKKKKKGKKRKKKKSKKEKSKKESCLSVEVSKKVSSTSVLAGTLLAN